MLDTLSDDGAMLDTLNDDGAIRVIFKEDGTLDAGLEDASIATTSVMPKQQSGTHSSSASGGEDEAEQCDGVGIAMKRETWTGCSRGGRPAGVGVPEREVAAEAATDVVDKVNGLAFLGYLYRGRTEMGCRGYGSTNHMIELPGFLTHCNPPPTSHSPATSAPPTRPEATLPPHPFPVHHAAAPLPPS